MNHYEKDIIEAINALGVERVKHIVKDYEEGEKTDDLLVVVEDKNEESLLEWTYSLPPNTTCNLLRALPGITKGQVIGIFNLRIPFKYKEEFLGTCQHVRFIESIKVSAATNSYLQISCTKGRYSLRIYDRDHVLAKTVCRNVSFSRKLNLERLATELTHFLPYVFKEAVS